MAPGVATVVVVIRISVCTISPPASGPSDSVNGGWREVFFATHVLGAVCIDVDEQFPALRSTLYFGGLGCVPNPFVTVDNM